MKDDIADFTKKIKTKKLLQVKQNIQRLTTTRPYSKNIKQTSTRGLSKDLINNYSILNRGKNLMKMDQKIIQYFNHFINTLRAQAK